MKNDDSERLASLMSIFTGYQVGVVLAILTAIFLATLYVLPDATMPLIILTIVLIAPFLFIGKAGKDEGDDEE